MFSVRFRVRVCVRIRVRHRGNDFCFSHQKCFSYTLNIWDKESIGLGKCTGWLWVTLTQGHGYDIDEQKFACLQDKVRTTQPITTQLSSYIPLVMVITWLDFGGILYKILVLATFLRKCRMCQGQTLFWTYLRNGWFDWCETKRRCISWILGELCDLDLWPHPWPWPLIFQGQISK